MLGLADFVEGMQGDLAKMERNPNNYRDAEFKFCVALLKRLIVRGERMLLAETQPPLMTLADWHEALGVSFGRRRR